MLPKQIPNILSICRIGLSGMLLLLSANSFLFLIIYLLAGITDVADGYIARKYRWTSRTGALLDSLADAVFSLAILLIISLNFRTVITGNLLWLVLILTLKLCSFTTGLIRFRKAVAIHTIANKATGLLLFFFIPLVFFSISGFFIKAIFIICLLPAIEEFFIILCCEELNMNRKSIFSK
ncbi:CDP-alcohol phosphatidyltransferase family protein [Paludibacter jiangxiensis]|uniref:CDP-diacylglycerol--glycerol-3-phosphate 3-phosphatidyltransferase n=1 Tax=Paludibacter jiangxiensis TaxID=681398 RepID=A0A170YSS6_9BACT|nr:CDP-alcohol phosphatidyltransferase family protein [Paludibacter jiangxiensis]GAT62038.1 CDP-diacylglycerol--glycerol-3-phosphate 3-phosphatidyltransferase [Paludibacter jiangxiensis]